MGAIADWPWYKQATAALALITAAATAIVGVSNAYGVAEPHWIATRFFVREQVTSAKADIKAEVQEGDRKQATRLDRIEMQLLQNDLNAALRERSAIRNKLSEHKATLTKDGALPAQARLIIEGAVDQLEDDQRFNEMRIDDLRRRISGQRP